jgi:non-specific serine/threonine protein kinase
VLLRQVHPTGIRFRLLDTIRGFGLERLSEGGGELSVRRRHRDYYLRLMESAGPRLFSAEGPAWVERMRLDHPNVRAALGFSLSQPGEAAAGLRLATVLWFGWRELGMIGEGRRWLSQLLAADRTGSAARARALCVNASLAILQGDVTAARASLAESTRAADQFNDDVARAFAEVFSGQVAIVEGDLAEAVRLLEHAAGAQRANRDAVGTAVAVILLTLAASAIGDRARASQLAGEYLSLCAEHGATLFAPFGHRALSIEHWRSGEIDRAVDEARDVVRLQWANHDPIGAGEGLEVLAWAAAARGDAERAAFFLGALVEVWRTVGTPLYGFPHLVRYHDQCLSTCRRILGTKTFEVTADRGARADFGDVVAYALDQRRVTAPAARGQTSSLLTRREREVAKLVAEGMSNREIGSALVVSPRTAEAHVEHILVKLGFTSRAQIATWVTAQQRDKNSG